jgi:hypothetical protein
VTLVDSQVAAEPTEFVLTQRATQLFFDLFFAANLTVFSQVHETSDASKLASYVGYFM